MTWTAIDDDLENKEAGIALWGIATGFFLLVNLLTQNSHNLVLGSIAGAFFLAFLIKTLGELERRGRAITKFRERPSRLREVLLMGSVKDKINDDLIDDETGRPICKFCGNVMDKCDDSSAVFICSPSSNGCEGVLYESGEYGW